MKNHLLLILFFSCSINLSAQFIKGKVSTEEGEALVGATVYIDGTTIGDATNTEGEFSFEYKNNLNALMVISFLGYKKAYIEQPRADTNYNIILKEDVSVMNEVVVFNNPFTREQMMKAFKEQFIGDKSLQKKCVILNEEDIRFKYNPRTLSFSAAASKPLHIMNNYLGYEVNYDLVQFQSIYHSFTLNVNEIRSNTYSGTAQFIEKESNKKLQKRRNKAFENSTISFFRSLKANKLKENGYQLYFKNFPVKPERFLSLENANQMTSVTVEQQERGFNPKNFVARLSILYDKKEQSAVSFYTNSFLIDTNGIHTNFNEILFSGTIANKKMALMLPANYQPNP